METSNQAYVPLSSTNFPVYFCNSITCRLCGCTGNNVSFTLLNETCLHTQYIQLEIGIKIRETDFLPKTVCKGCLDKIDFVKNFKRDCRKAQQLLEEMYNRHCSTLQKNANNQAGEKTFGVIANLPQNAVLLQVNTPTQIPQQSKPVWTKRKSPRVKKKMPVPTKIQKLSDEQIEIKQESENELEFEEVIVKTETEITVENSSQKVVPQSLLYGLLTDKNSEKPEIIVPDRDFQLSEHTETSETEIQGPLDEEILPSFVISKDATTSNVNAIEDEAILQTYEISKDAATSNVDGADIISTAHKFIKRISNNIFECTLCKDTFKTPYLAETHGRKMHTEIMPYQCSLCDKGYLTWYHFSKHERSYGHSIRSQVAPIPIDVLQSKKFQCSICTKVCKSLDDLKNHKRRHRNKYLHSDLDVDDNIKYYLNNS